MAVNRELLIVLAQVNKGRASHTYSVLSLERWNPDGRARYQLTDADSGHTVSPICTAKEMEKVLDTLDEIYRPWGKDS